MLNPTPLQRVEKEKAAQIKPRVEKLLWEKREDVVRSLLPVQRVLREPCHRASNPDRDIDATAMNNCCSFSYEEGIGA
jgi:hypothetical protein